MPNNDRTVPQGRVRRVVPVAGFTARALGGRLVAGLQQKSGVDDAVARFHERAAQRYAEILGNSKGVLMKVGQMMSMVDARALGTGDFWPHQKALEQLQTNAPPMHADLVRQVVDHELGTAVAQFAEFDTTAMAAASIGQVHRAVLRDGREVVAKIQYLGVAQAIRDDLANTELIATFIRFMTAASGIKTDIRAVAREAAARVSEEVDYRHEAATITTFARLYRDHPFIRVPEVIPQLSGDRIVTMTYLDGMGWACAQRADQELKNTWAEVIIRFNQANFRHANLMHADPHPGNFRFNTDGTVGFVDFGCVKVMPERERWRLVSMMRAVMDGRKEDYRDLMVQAGFLTADSVLTADELYQWQASALYEMTTAPQPATYSAETNRRVIRSLVDLQDRDHPLPRMKSPDDYVFASRATFALAAVTAGLTATLPIRSIFADIDNVAEPLTELGKQHRAWLRDRDLPNALDHHDHR